MSLIKLFLFFYLVDTIVFASYTFNYSAPRGSVRRDVWTGAIGSAHAAYALRDDWQDALKTVVKDLEISRVRFHGILDDDVGPIVMLNNDIISYNFSGIDAIYDAVLQVGAVPLIELSFMPEALASCNRHFLRYDANVCPPTSVEEWGDLISALGEHLVDRYGSDVIEGWIVEVWNEPNGGFWAGTQEDYFALYNTTARVLKDVAPGLLIGGPVTQAHEWIADFIGFVFEEDIPLDFISTHAYPNEVNKGANRDALNILVNEARDAVDNAMLAQGLSSGFPLLISEYNSGLYHPLGPLLPHNNLPWISGVDGGHHDSNFAASFIAHSVPRLAIESINPSSSSRSSEWGVIPSELIAYWTFSDIFDEVIPSDHRRPFYNGYGLQTKDGIPKPSYRSFQLLGSLLEFALSQVPVDGMAGSCSETIGVIATTSNIESNDEDDMILQILVSNFDAPPRFTASHGPGCNVTVNMINLPFNNVMGSNAVQATVQRIDEYNANALTAWKNMGSPSILNITQVEFLQNASMLSSENIDVSYDELNGGLSFQIEMPVLSVALVSVSISISSV